MKAPETETGLVTVESALPVRRAAPGDTMELMLRAVESKADVATMERLMAMRRELKAEQAKEAYETALAAFQAECPIIKKGKSVFVKGAERYRYAPLDEIVLAVRELLQKHGFSYDIDSEVEQGWVKAICNAKHSMGHSERRQFKVPIDKDAYMSEPQKFGAAITFAKRYAFCNAFGILTGDQDNDAVAPAPPPKGPNSLAGSKPLAANDAVSKRKLVDLTRSVHGCKGYAMDEKGKALLFQWLIDEAVISDTETLEDLAGARLVEVLAKVENRNQK